MPKPVTTNEQIAQGIVDVLKHERISVANLIKKVPRRFWDKVRDAMGNDPPDKGTISARWNRPSSGPEIKKLVESWLPAQGCQSGESPCMDEQASPDASCDPHLLEPLADIEADPADDLDSSMIVDMGGEDLVSVGVMTEALDDLDPCDPDSAGAVDVYGRDVDSLVDTIDIETGSWPLESSAGPAETVVMVNELESRLTERLDNLIQELEARLTLRLQTLVQTAVKQAISVPGGVLPGPNQEECPVDPKARAKRAAKKVALRISIDAKLFDLFDTERRLRYHGNTTQAMNAILWHHYGKPKLSFETAKPGDSEQRSED